MFNRREFIQTGATGALWLAADLACGSIGQIRRSDGAPRFVRDYAPHLGLFRHHAGADPIEQLRFAAEAGFRSIEDTGLLAKPASVQAQMGEELARRGMALVLFAGVADFGRPTFASGLSDLRRDVLAQIHVAVEAAQRTGGRAISVVPGKIDGTQSTATQRKHAVELLRLCTEICAARLDPVAGTHRPWSATVTSVSAIGTPGRRLVSDSRQPLLPLAVGRLSADGHWRERAALVRDIRDVLGHVQLGDYPGRQEPGTGVFDFRQLLLTLDECGYRGSLGMEHGTSIPGRPGERLVIDAYVRLDSLSRFHRA